MSFWLIIKSDDLKTSSIHCFTLTLYKNISHCLHCKTYNNFFLLPIVNEKKKSSSMTFVRNKTTASAFISFIFLNSLCNLKEAKNGIHIRNLKLLTSLLLSQFLFHSITFTFFIFMNRCRWHGGTTACTKVKNICKSNFKSIS